MRKILLDAAWTATKLVAMLACLCVLIMLVLGIVALAVVVASGAPPPLAAPIALIVFFWLAIFSIKVAVDWPERSR